MIDFSTTIATPVVTHVVVPLQELLENCVCGSSKSKPGRINGIKTAECRACGVIRQRVQMSPAQHSEFYRNYHTNAYIHNYAHDSNVAWLRIAEYKDKVKGRTLDVGCGSGAFVQACRTTGVEAYGQDIQSSPHGYNDQTYLDKLENIHFPTEHFDLVTVHDVLEHVLDPVAFLKELFRITKNHLIIDFPNYFIKAGKHHWKKVEHLWMFRKEQLIKLIEDAKFDIQEIHKPIPSKLVIYATRPEVKQPSILLPGGIGDAYWSMVKAKSFLELLGCDWGDFWITEFGDGRQRGKGLIEKIPFAKFAGYKLCTLSYTEHVEACIKGTRSLFRDVNGCDYYLAVNGELERGKLWSEILPHLETNWDISLFESLAERQYARSIHESFGDFILGFFPDHGMYKTDWLVELSPDQIFRALKRIHKRTGKRILLLGADWDKDSLHAEFAAQSKGFIIDWAGKTTLPQMIGLVRRSTGVIGFPAGNTMMGPILGIPTLLIWHKYFRKEFWQNVCPPDSRNNWYKAVDTAEMNHIKLAKTFLDMII